MAIVHPVQERVVMSNHAWRLFEFETSTEEEAQAFAARAQKKGWKTWCLGYTFLTHTVPPQLDHGGTMVKLIERPTGPDGKPCRCSYCE